MKSWIKNDVSCVTKSLKYNNTEDKGQNVHITDCVNFTDLVKGTGMDETREEEEIMEEIKREDKWDCLLRDSDKVQKIEKNRS